MGKTGIGIVSHCQLDWILSHHGDACLSDCELSRGLTEKGRATVDGGGTIPTVNGGGAIPTVGVGGAIPTVGVDGTIQ